MAGLLGEQRRHRFEVGAQLAPEPASDLQGDYLDLGHRHVKHAAYLVAHPELALATVPDRQPAVLSPEGGTRLRLDVPLVHHLGAELPLHDNVRLGEGRVGIAQYLLRVARDVAAGLGLESETLRRRDVLVQDGSAGPHGVLDVRDGGEHLVLHLDQVERFLRRVGVGCRHGGDRMSLVKGFVVREDGSREVAEAHHEVLAHVHEPVVGPWQIGVGHDRHHTGMGGGTLGVDRLDPRVGVRTAQDLPMQKSWKLDVGPVDRPPGDLIGAVVTDRSRPYYLELALDLGFGHGCHDIHLYRVRAAERPEVT